MYEHNSVLMIMLSILRFSFSTLSLYTLPIEVSSMCVHNSILMLCKIFGDFHFHRKFIYITGLGIIYVWAQFNFYDSVKYLEIFIFNPKFIYITDRGFIYVCAQFILTILPKIWRFMNPKYNTSPIKVTSMSTIQFFMLCKIFGDFNSKD